MYLTSTSGLSLDFVCRIERKVLLYRDDSASFSTSFVSGCRHLLFVFIISVWVSVTIAVGGLFHKSV